MKFNYLFCLLPLLLLSGCNTPTNNNNLSPLQCHFQRACSAVTHARWYRHTQLIQEEGRDVRAYYQFRGYNNLILNGNFNVQGRKTRYTDEPIILTGDRAIMSHIQARVENNTLVLQLDPHYDYAMKHPITIELPYQTLKGCTFKGVGNLVISDLNTKGFNLNIDGNVNAWFKGNIVLANLNANNDGKINLHWVNTRCLQIHASKKGSIMLGGIANYMNATMSDSARLDARFLRVKTARIHTQQCGVAEVTVLKNLTMLAEDNSNIYYYQRPEFIAQYMHGSGAIIDMKGVYEPLPQELR